VLRCAVATIVLLGAGRWFPFGVCAGGLACSALCCVWLLFSVPVGLRSRAATPASAVFFGRLYYCVGSLRVTLGFLLDFLPLPPFPPLRLFVTQLLLSGAVHGNH
jgi:hypothetical protein